MAENMLQNLSAGKLEWSNKPPTECTFSIWTGKAYMQSEDKLCV